MRLRSVNVGLPREMSVGSGKVLSGIHKTPVKGRVQMGRWNLSGDGQADLESHGGVEKAVYVYAHDHYAFWESELGRRDLQPGAFGENFTAEGMTDVVVGLGDVYRVGTGVVRVTQPRVPCAKLGALFGDPRFPKRFLASRRPGFYLEVLEEGMVEEGNEVELLERDPKGMPVAEALSIRFFDAGNEAALRRILSIGALSQAWRTDIESLVARLQRESSG